MKYLNFLFGTILLFFWILILKQDQYTIIPIHKWISILYDNATAQNNSIVMSLYSIFIPIQISFLGIILAIISILVARTKISIKAYFLYYSMDDWVLVSFILYFLSLTLSINTVFLRSTTVVMIYLVVSNIFPIFCISLFGTNLVRLESKKYLRKRLKDRIEKNKPFDKYFSEVFIPIFHESIYSDILEIVKELKDRQLIQKEYLYDVVSEMNNMIEKAQT